MIDVRIEDERVLDDDGKFDVVLLRSKDTRPYKYI